MPEVSKGIMSPARASSGSGYGKGFGYGDGFDTGYGRVPNCTIFEVVNEEGKSK